LKAHFATAARKKIETKNRLSYGEIKRWHARLRALPAWQKTLAQCAILAAVAA
jgi:hypothetical protein